MPQQGRLGDKSMVPADSHGCPGCPHPCIGPAVAGSPDVFVNSKPALRVGDPGVHAACCGPNTWKAKAGAPHVFINDKKAHRLGDADTHCGGTGKLIEGSPNVIVGNGGGGGGGGGSSLAKAALTSPAAQAAMGKLAKKVVDYAKKLGAKKLNELANKGLDKALEKMGVSPELAAKIKKVVGPAMSSAINDIVNGRPPNVGKMLDGMLSGAVDVALEPLKGQIGKLTKHLEEQIGKALGEAGDKVGAAVHGAIASAVANSVGGALDGAVTAGLNAGIRGKNPLTAALQGAKSGALSGAKSGAISGGKKGWEEHERRRREVEAFAAQHAAEERLKAAAKERAESRAADRKRSRRRPRKPTAAQPQPTSSAPAVDPDLAIYDAEIERYRLLTENASNMEQSATGMTDHWRAKENENRTQTLVQGSTTILKRGVRSDGAKQALDEGMEVVDTVNQGTEAIESAKRFQSDVESDGSTSAVQNFARDQGIKKASDVASNLVESHPALGLASGGLKTSANYAATEIAKDSKEHHAQRAQHWRKEKEKNAQMLQKLLKKRDEVAAKKNEPGGGS